MTLDQVAADRRDVLERPQARLIAALRRAGGEVAQELREGVLAGSEEDRVGVRRGFLGQRGDVQAAERDVRALAAVVIGNPIRAIGVGDVDLDDDQVRVIVEIERLDVLVLQRDVERRDRDTPPAWPGRAAETAST